MSRSKIHNWLLLGILVLSSIAARPAQDWPPGTAILHGFVFHDLNSDGMWNHPNGNGSFAPEEPATWEPGFGGVPFTVSCGSYEEIFYSEPRSVDEAGNVYATGDFGPILSECEWTVTMHVPEGYIATTAASQKIAIPEAGATAFPAALFGLAPGKLPVTGYAAPDLIKVAGGFFGMQMLVAVVLGLIARRQSKS